MKKKPIVFFNASVILAGLNSPKGGSAKILTWAKDKKIKGIISEIVEDEVLKHSKKIGVSKNRASQKINKIFKGNIKPAPKTLSQKFQKISIDAGDTHLFESAKNASVDYLVSLDKKHVLGLKARMKKFQIFSPGELIQELRPISKIPPSPSKSRKK